MLQYYVMVPFVYFGQESRYIYMQIRCSLLDCRHVAKYSPCLGSPDLFIDLLYLDLYKGKKGHVSKYLPLLKLQE